VDILSLTIDKIWARTYNGLLNNKWRAQGMKADYTVKKKLRNSQTRKKGYASPLYGLFPESGATVVVGYLANYEKI
jgi:hypothetical protein